MRNIRLLRIALGLSQEALAKRLRIDSTALSHIENGWLPRNRAALEKRFKSIFGPEWTFDKLLEQAPDIRPLLNSHARVAENGESKP
jgi:transcriptional regulator with XRE-family HTH domain